MSTNKKTDISLLYDELEGVLNLMHSMFGSYDNSPWEIDKDVDLKSTHDILKLVPEKDVCKLVALYRIFSIKDASKKPDLIKYLHEEVKFNYPKKKIKKIINDLMYLINEGWLSHDYVNKIKENIAYSHKGSWYIAHTLLYRNARTGGAPLKNATQTILIAFLTHFLIEKGVDNIRSYNLVADFLTEQGLIDGISAHTVEKRYRRYIDSPQKVNTVIKRTGKILKLMIDLQSRPVPKKLSLRIEKELGYPPIPNFDKILKILDLD